MDISFFDLEKSLKTIEYKPDIEKLKKLNLHIVETENHEKIIVWKCTLK